MITSTCPVLGCDIGGPHSHEATTGSPRTVVPERKEMIKEMMPVPRCAACRRWTPEASGVTVLGHCDELGRWTAPGFGCVAWEARS